MYEAHVFERQLQAYSEARRQQMMDRYAMEAAIARGRVLRSKAAVGLIGQFAAWIAGLAKGGKTARA